MRIKNRLFSAVIFPLAILVFVIGLIGCGATQKVQYTAGNSLLGLSPAQVIERLGVPESVSSGACGYGFHYPGKGRKPEEVIKFHGDCAFWVMPGFKEVVFRKLVPQGKVYPGQPVRRMVELLGPPKKIYEGTSAMELVFAGGRKVAVAHGLVLYVKE